MLVLLIDLMIMNRNQRNKRTWKLKTKRESELELL